MLGEIAEHKIIAGNSYLVLTISTLLCDLHTLVHLILISQMRNGTSDIKSLAQGHIARK